MRVVLYHQLVRGIWRQDEGSLSLERAAAAENRTLERVKGMFMHRVTRGYVVLIAGLIAFFGRRLLAGDTLWPPGMLDAEILSETEMWIVISTALLIGPAVALGRLRAMLIALPFSLPPIMLYLTFYPLLIIFLLLAMVPWLVHAALSAWMPAQQHKT